jgi:hypothetical protein
LQHNDDAVVKFPSLLMAVQCFYNIAALHDLTDEKTEAFAFHQLLHHKKKLSDDGSELLASAKLIIVNFISNLISIASVMFGLPVKTKLQVLHR